MRWLHDYAAQQSSGISFWMRDSEHFEKAFVFGGMTARDGVTAALLVQAGWSGVNDAFSGADNFLIASLPKADPTGLVDKLGERYEVVRTNIKKWTVGSPIQAPLDALEYSQEAAVRAGSGQASHCAPGHGRSQRSQQSRHPGHLPSVHAGGDAYR
jgi:2-methylcitrate dehydratase PrpD